MVWGDGQIFLLEESTVPCHFSGNIQLLWYMNYLSCSLKDWLPFTGYVWEQQRNLCCSHWCWHPQTVKYSCRSATIISPVVLLTPRCLPVLLSKQEIDLACFKPLNGRGGKGKERRKKKVKKSAGLQIFKNKLWAITHHSKEKGTSHHFHVCIFRE